MSATTRLFPKTIDWRLEPQHENINNRLHTYTNLAAGFAKVRRNVGLHENQSSRVDLSGLRLPSPRRRRKIGDDLKATLEQLRETIKSDIWIPGQARNDEFLEVPIGRNAGEPVSMSFFSS